VAPPSLRDGAARLCRHCLSASWGAVPICSAPGCMAHEDPNQRTSLRDAAIQGSAWTTAQVVVNKVAAAVATIALGFLLSAEDYGIAWFAITAGQFLVVLPVVAMIDVLLASPGRILGVAGGAQRVVTRMALTQSVTVIGAGTALALAYPERSGLLLLMVLVAMRPLMDAATVVPMSRMRIRLEYPVLAKFDCVAALLSSMGSVALAAMGAGGSAIVAPPIAAIALRAFLYRRHCRGEVGPSRDHARFRPALWRAFLWAAIGSYVAAAFACVDIVALGTFCDDRSLGIYSFAASLSTQLGMIIAFQASNAIQPIIGQLKHDPRRQAEGAHRAIAMVGAVLVPLLLVQAAIGGPLIAVVWGGKWDDAIIVFQVVSLAQAVGAVQWPAAFIIKAQGRFKPYLLLQGGGIAVTGVACPVAATHPGWAVSALESVGLTVSDAAAPGAAVALVSLAMAVLMTPVAAWLCLRAVQASMPRVTDLLWRPWMTAAPVALTCGWAADGVHGSGLARTATAALLVLLAAVGAGVGVAMAVLARASTRLDALEIAKRAKARLFAT
jgi:O-antigen/teichoic acid export membrane protein